MGGVSAGVISFAGTEGGGAEGGVCPSGMNPGATLFNTLPTGDEDVLTVEDKLTTAAIAGDMDALRRILRRHDAELRERLAGKIRTTHRAAFSRGHPDATVGRPARAAASETA